MNKDYIDSLWHEAELASVNSELEIHQIFYWKIVNEERAAYMDMMRPQVEEDLKNALA